MSKEFIEKDRKHYEVIKEIWVDLHREALKKSIELANKILLDKSMDISFKEILQNEEIKLIAIYSNEKEIGRISFFPQIEFDSAIWENPKYKVKKWITNFSLSPQLFWHIPLNHIDMIKDKEFKKEWNNKKKEQIKFQNNKCLLCNQEFTKENPAVMHHKYGEGNKKDIFLEKEKIINQIIELNLTLEEGIRRIERKFLNYVLYYKSLKDIELICKKCHREEHESLIKEVQNFKSSIIATMDKKGIIHYKTKEKYFL